MPYHGIGPVLEELSLAALDEGSPRLLEGGHAAVRPAHQAAGEGRLDDVHRLLRVLLLVAAGAQT